MLYPQATPRNTVMMSICMRKFGNDRANQPAVIQLQPKLDQAKPTLKKLALLATAKPRAIKISGPIAREISKLLEYQRLF